MLTRMSSFSETPANSSWLRGSKKHAATDRPSVARIVELAAAGIGAEDEASAVVKAMEASGVRWAWQLQHLQPHHWADFGASPGLETSIRHELQHPSTTVSACKAELYQAGAAAERLRRFLLLPGPDGQEPGRLHDPNGPLLTLLTVPPADRQKLMLTLCELLALVSGLMLPVPLQLIRLHSWTKSTSWTSLPSVEDWFDMLLMLSFTNLFLSIFISSFLAVMVSASGFNASLEYYDAIINILGPVFNITVFNILLTLTPMVFWHLFNVAGSPYPLLSMTLFSTVLYNRLTTLIWKFHIRGMALEIYHLPNYILCFPILITFGGLWKDLSAVALKPKARLRAAELRKMMGIDEVSSVSVAMQADGAATRYKMRVSPA